MLQCVQDEGNTKLLEFHKWGTENQPNIECLTLERKSRDYYVKVKTVVVPQKGKYLESIVTIEVYCKEGRECIWRKGEQLLRGYILLRAVICGQFLRECND